MAIIYRESLTTFMIQRLTMDGAPVLHRMAVCPHHHTTRPARVGKNAHPNCGPPSLPVFLGAIIQAHNR